MDSIQFSEFSTTGVNNSDTFDVWRKKTNGVIGQLVTINDSISPLFYGAGQTQSALLRTVTLDDSQTITGAKTFSGGTKAFPILKVGTAGFYEDSGVLGTTGAFISDRIIINSELQFGTHSYTIPNNNPVESSLLEKSGNSLSWKTLSSIISVIQQEGAVNVVTTNIVLPVGSIIDYAVSAGSVPSNWLRLSGGRFKGGDYPELAALILNAYGIIYTTQTGTTQAPTVSYNSNWWYTLPNTSGKIIKAVADSVVNTFIDRGNAFDIIKNGSSIQSLSLANGGTGILNLRHDNTLRIDTATRELGVAPFSVGADKIASNAIDPSKLSFGGPSWDTSSSLYEGSDPNTRARVATRDYVDSKISKAGPVKKLVSRLASNPHSSAPAFGEFCYINHDGVPIITGVNTSSRFGFADKYAHTEMPLPDNRHAVELHVGYDHMCALDETGELWAIGNNSYNKFNIVPGGDSITRAIWTKAFTPLYTYSTNNKIRKVILSGDITTTNVAVIDTSNRLWIAGRNYAGVLGRGVSGDATSTNTKPAGEATPVLENVLDAFLVGSSAYEVCIALTSAGIHMSGYGGVGQNGIGNSNVANGTFNTIPIDGISNYGACSIYGSGEDQYTTIYVKTPNNLVYGWGYNGNSVLGNGGTATITRPTAIFDNPDLNIDSLYTNVNKGPIDKTGTYADEAATGAAYISGVRNNATAPRGATIQSTVAGHTLGTSISSSDSGNIIAVGAPGANGRVQCHVYTNNVWSNYGPVISGAETLSLFGQSVSLNSEGSRLCIGVPDGQLVGSSRSGQVRIYDYSIQGASWMQRNLSFNGELAASKLGSSVALSGDGNTFIAGAPGYNSNTGRVYIRRITATGTETVGDPITGTAASQQCGIKVAINTSGTVIAIASNGISTAGVVRVYTLVGGTWVRVGGDIVGRAATDDAINISLNGAGTLLVVGAPGSDIAGSNSGSTRVFSYNPQTLEWVQLGADILGQSVNESSGSSVAFSRDGAVLAVGAPGADALNLTDNGVVRLFKYDDNKWKLLTAALIGTMAGEGFGRAVAISATGTNILASSPTWNSSRGQVNSIGFVSAPTISYEVWCTGTNTGNKFSFAGNVTTWRRVGELPTGYAIEDFWPGSGYYANSVNFIKARRLLDGINYLFVVGANSRYESGYGNKTVLNTWTRLNLQSHIVDRIIDIQSVSPYAGEAYTILHLNDGTLYFAGYNSYSIDPNLPTSTYRTNFTRIK